MFQQYFSDFKSIYEEKYAWRYGFYRPVIDNEAGKYLKCGILKHGFARVRCSDCGTECLLAFSCKSRLCTSCMTKSMLEFEEFVIEKVLRRVPHRHIVFAIPKAVRGAFMRDRDALNELSRLA